MRNLRWICWYLWEGLPTLLAFPIDSSNVQGNSDFWSNQWENHWIRYAIGTVGFVVIGFTLAGCLCCRRQRRLKGFQDDAGNGKEFKDGSTAGTETTIERIPSASLELEVPRIFSPSGNKSSNDEIASISVDGRITIKPPSPLFFDEPESAANFTRSQPCSEWFESANFPREKLKYLREIGHGWFGKVVEGTTEIDSEVQKPSPKNRGVVVRILTEEATSSEKSWFLGESTPYLKLRHPNVLALLGSCLEADPYLLLFESCPAGDLKSFLLTNRSNATALQEENLPTRLAINIADALEHMHAHGFAHTDLSARNCLVAPDLTAKLGDYGTGVEKYPQDYYIVGDRALPIRWSAPESLECTKTTIETRSITSRANLWSYGVLLWEIASWAERPYDDFGDEQVIESIFSRKSEFASEQNSKKMLDRLLERCALPTQFRDSLVATWKFSPTERASLREMREILLGKSIEDFERRWENSRPNGATNSVDKSASLRDLRGSVDSGLWQATASEEKKSVANFRLGPDEPTKYCMRENSCLQESGSETEEESWRGRVERGAYTEKVKQKSKSVADLMVLVHIDSDSDVEISLGPQTTEKLAKKRLPASGSDGDLRSAVIVDEFDEALRKLREPSSCSRGSSRIPENVYEHWKTGKKLSERTKNDDNELENVGKSGENVVDESWKIGKNIDDTWKIGKNIAENVEIDESEANISGNIPRSIVIGKNFQKIDENVDKSVKIGENRENTKLLTLTHQGQTPILRLSFGTPEEIYGDPAIDKLEDSKEITAENSRPETDLKKDSKNPADISRTESHVLRLVSKGDPDLPVLRYVPERTSTPENLSKSPNTETRLVSESHDASLSSPDSDQNGVDVKLWNDALAHELEKKNPAFVENSIIFNEPSDEKSIFTDLTLIAVGKKHFPPKRSKSDPNTPKSLLNLSAASKLDDDFVPCTSSSAPETPRRNYSIPTLDDSNKIRKSVNFYRDDDDLVRGSSSAPETPFRGNYPVHNVDDDSSICEELEPGMIKRSANEADDEEDRKLLSTPDDERSSDSGFRDKESCEEEESPIPGPQVSSVILGNSSSVAGNLSPLSASAEEEQMRILFELDTILDAEYYGNFCDKIDETENSLDNVEMSLTDREELANSPDNTGPLFTDRDDLTSSPDNVEIRLTDRCEIADKVRSISESLESTESTEILETVRANSCEPDFLDNFYDKKDDEAKVECFHIEENILVESTEADTPSENSRVEENRSRKDQLPSSTCESPLRTDENSSCKFSSTRQNIASIETDNDSSLVTTKLNTDMDYSLDIRLDSTSDSNNLVGMAEFIDSARPGSSGSLPNSIVKAYCTSAKAQDSENSSDSPAEVDRDKFGWTDKSSISIAKPDRTNCATNDSDNCSSSAGMVVCANLSPVDNSEICDINSPNSVDKVDRENCPSESSSCESPLKTNRPTELSAEGQPDNSDGERWSSRENMNENEDEDSSTMSLRSDNSYVSFGLDEEFVAAIRNELREKLPRAQMPVVEALDPHDDKESASINDEMKNWDDEEDEMNENAERSGGGVDISIRYNIYGTPLSPIMEERESGGTSESLVSKESSGDASLASRVSALSEDVLVVDTRTNRAIIVEGGATSGSGEILNSQQDDDRDTSHGDFSDEENLEYPQNNSSRCLESKRISMGIGGAPLPSPEEETKWQQQFPLPLQMQDDLMSTSFGTDRDWDSQDDEECEDEADEDEEENSSSSGEFIWKRYDEYHGDLENVATRSPPNKPKSQEPEVDLDDDDDDREDNDEDDEEEEFTPSAWDATLAPHRSALRSPEKTVKSGDQKKSVWFKKQRYHCVYEYPKETPVVEGQGQSSTTWEPTSYADWEEMMDEPRVNAYPMEYDETTRAGDEEFYVSSSNRPFQFQSGEGKYVSQFFPGASSTLLQHENQQQQQQQQPLQILSTSLPCVTDEFRTSQDEGIRIDGNSETSQSVENSRGPDFVENQQQPQLGELRHTRDRLKLNLLSTSGSGKPDEETKSENRIEQRQNSGKMVATAGKIQDVAVKTRNSENRKDIDKNVIENIEKVEENAPKSEKNALKLVERDDKSEANQIVGENAGKSEGDPVKTTESADETGENAGGILPTIERSSVNEQISDKGETPQLTEEETKANEESSNSKSLDDAAVKKESSIMEKNNDKARIIDVRDIETEISTIDLLDIDNEQKRHESTACSEKNSKLGDQDLFRSRMKSNDDEGKILDTPKLEMNESYPSCEGKNVAEARAATFQSLKS